MNDLLARTIDNNCPKFNKDVTEGTAKEILKTIPDYLDDIIKSSLRSLTPKITLTYKGYRKVTPLEEFQTMLGNSSIKSVYDLAESDLYLTNYVFEYQGQEIVCPLFLPYCENGNIIKVSNTKYHIIPVLSDTVISPSYNEIFVRLLKDKLTFKSQCRNFILNGEKIPGHIIYTNIVKLSTMKIKDNIGRPMTSVSLYLLGYYGVRGVLKKYCNLNEGDYIITNGNVDKYRDDYNVYESTKIKPRSLKETVYLGHDVKVCIKKDKTITHFLSNFIYGLIYSLDILPEHANDFIKVYESKDIKDELLYWKIFLGRVVYKNSFSIDRIVADMYDHFYNLQGYLDNLIKRKLQENSIYVDNFFDLLVVILENYNIWLINSKEYNSNINNRYIDILYYIMYDIIVGFNKVILNINKRVSKKGDGDLSHKEILKIINNELRAKKIYGIVKSSSPSMAILAVDSSLDIKYPKITAILED